MFVVRVWQRLILLAFRSRSFRYAFYDYLTSIRAPAAPRLLLDPFECIGASIVAEADYYEAGHLRALRHFVLSRSGGRRILYVDVGANIGNHLIALSDIFNYAIAFEPIPFNYHCCLANISYNGLENIDLLQVALGCRDSGDLTLSLPVSSSWGAPLKRNNGLFSAAATGARRRFFAVPLHAGDAYLRATSAYPFVLIKIDCEGAELEVLRGIRQFLASSSCQELLFAIEILDGLIGAQIFDYLKSFRPIHIYAYSGSSFSLVHAEADIPFPSSMVLVHMLPLGSSG